MQYITKDGLVNAVGELLLRELSDSDTSAGAVVREAVLEEVNEEAVSVIHSYLKGVYTLPVEVAKVPLIRTLTIDLMRVRLYVRRDPGNVPDSVTELYDNAMALLKKLQSRVLYLGATLAQDSTGELADGSSTGDVRYSTYPARFEQGFSRL